MEISLSGDRALSALDHVRLSRLIRRAGQEPTLLPDSAINAVLDSAELVSSRTVAADIVTMSSQVELADLGTGARYKLTVCCPQDADPALGLVSVLSPVGTSLIGRRMGGTAQWPAPGGSHGTATILALHFQPEANGDYITSSTHGGRWRNAMGTFRLTAARSSAWVSQSGAGVQLRLVHLAARCCACASPIQTAVCRSVVPTNAAGA